MARIKHEQKMHYLGSFPEDREEDAARAFDAASRLYRGAAAHGGRNSYTGSRYRLNFPTKQEVAAAASMVTSTSVEDKPGTKSARGPAARIPLKATRKRIDSDLDATLESTEGGQLSEGHWEAMAQARGRGEFTKGELAHLDDSELFSMVKEIKRRRGETLRGLHKWSKPLDKLRPACVLYLCDPSYVSGGEIKRARQQRR